MSEQARAAEDKAREFRKIDFAELVTRLAESQKTLIITHAHPDGDAIGSAFALRLLLEAAGSPAYCLCADEPHRRYRFACEHIQQSTLADSMSGEFKEDCRIVTVDTASLAQMGKLGDEYGHKVDIMIDHHGRGELYADGYVDPDAAATGEIIFDLSREFLHRGIISAIPDGFDTLAYIAIATDTGCFKYSNTTPETHRRVAEMMPGLDYAELNFRLFDAKTPEELRVTKTALSSIKYFSSGEISLIPLTLKQKAELDIPDDYIDLLINIARAIEGVKVAVSLRETSSATTADGSPINNYKASLRSNCSLDVAEICARYGGGGHKKAAGCTLTAPDIDTAIDMIVGEIQRELKE